MTLDIAKSHFRDGKVCGEVRFELGSFLESDLKLWDILSLWYIEDTQVEISNRLQGRGPGSGLKCKSDQWNEGIYIHETR